MYISTTFLTAILAALPTALSIAIPDPMALSPDPAGEKNIGNGHGGQFIGGACLSAADCASACCATLNGAGICSGPGAQFQAGKQGCGFGGGGSPSSSNNNNNGGGGSGGNGGSNSVNGATIDTSIPGSQSVGKANGQQFITGQCTSNADCASGCCAGLPTANKGPTFAVCSGPAVGNAAGKTGCGFTVGGSSSKQSSSPPPPSQSSSNNNSGFSIDTSIPGSQSVGKGNAQQFITGQCTSNADCASGCCAGLPTANKGPTFAVCSGPAVGNVAGKTGCGFKLNRQSQSQSQDTSADEVCSDAEA